MGSALMALVSVMKAGLALLVGSNHVLMNARATAYAKMALVIAITASSAMIALKEISKTGFFLKMALLFVIKAGLARSVKIKNATYAKANVSTDFVIVNPASQERIAMLNLVRIIVTSMEFVKTASASVKKAGSEILARREKLSMENS